MIRFLERIRRPDSSLFLLFLFTLPLVTPYLRGDGVGYYAYVASLVIDHDLQFEDEYRHADIWHSRLYFDEQDQVRPRIRTPTGYLRNQFSVGPSLFWTPFFLLAHLGVSLYNALPWTTQPLPADGFSWPYLYLSALGTALLGFVGLLLSYNVARKVTGEWAALWATLGIWLASGLLVYIYFLPFMSHAHSAFIAALFVWFWWRTYTGLPDNRPTLRSAKQWFVLGLLAGLLFTTYYINALLWIFILVDGLTILWGWYRRRIPWPTCRILALQISFLFASGLLLGLAPHMLIKARLYGSPLALGYGESWYWTSPRLVQVLFSSEHGLWTWTPVIFLACLGFIPLIRRQPALGWRALLTFAIFWYVIAAYQNWHGQSSFSNRFFLSLTPLFVLGLAAFLETMASRLRTWKVGRHWVVRPALVGGLVLLMLWNAGFVFQWGTNIVPNRGPVSFAEVARNQVTVVPTRLTGMVRRFLFDRQNFVKEIEREEIEEAQQYRIRR